MSQFVDDALAQPRLNTYLLTAFAAAALALAGIGLFGVLAYSVAQRTHEIGIRMALGAKASDVQRLVLGNALRMLLSGGSIGLAAAFALTRLMKSLLFGSLRNGRGDVRVSRVWCWRSSPSWQEQSQPAAPPASTHSKPCAMTKNADSSAASL